MFGTELKRWRGARRYTQEALADAATVSPRHLSCLERGVAWPSEAMVLRLARALDLPLRERNALLHAAGYAARWSDAGEELPESLEDAVGRLLSGTPWPTFALSGTYRVLAANKGAHAILGQLTTKNVIGLDMARAMLSDGPHRALIENYDEAAAAFLARVRADAASQGPTSPLWTVADEATHLANERPVPAEPVLPLTLKVGGVSTRWLTVLMTFGTAQDAGVEHLTIEQLLPADEATAEIARGLAQM